MSLLLVTGAAGMFVGAQGVPPLGLFVADDGRPRARLRRRQRAQPRARRGHRPADGQADGAAPGRRGPGAAVAGARVRARPLGALLRPAREHGQRPDRRARARREPLLRARLHALAEALDAAEHRHRRSRGRGAAARRLRGRVREPRPAGAVALPDRLPLDAAALLGARAPDQGRLRERRRADAAGRSRRAGDDAPDRALHDRPRRVHARRRLLARAGLHRRRGRARRRLPRARVAAPPRHDAAARRRSSSTTPSPTSRCSSSRRP